MTFRCTHRADRVGYYFAVALALTGSIGLVVLVVIERGGV